MRNVPVRLHKWQAWLNTPRLRKTITNRLDSQCKWVWLQFPVPTIYARYICDYGLDGRKLKYICKILRKGCAKLRLLHFAIGWHILKTDCVNETKRTFFIYFEINYQKFFSIYMDLTRKLEQIELVIYFVLESVN